ncbi:MAG: hypothetical protein HW387_983 [Parachlamydiales bacterium]|nr:hypothetical protein [Parachlamydiales bacterium]
MLQTRITEQLQPFVSCQFKGQLGNQLFIIAATLSHAWDTGAIGLFPGLNTKTNRTSINKERLFFRLNDSPLPRPIRHTFQEKLWFRWEKIPAKPDLMLDGYFQSWKYFNHHRDEVLSAFAPSSFTLNVLDQKYHDLIDHPNTVSIHVRTAGKYLHASKIHQFIGLEYYREAMALFPSDTKFVIFSDRINWCKTRFALTHKNICFIDGNNGIEDLFLMSKMKHNIVANSTFSWWAAYLNQNPNKKVVVPSLWYGEPYPTDTNDLFYPDWKIISLNHIEPYPKDMYDYGDTQSCDNAAWDQIGKARRQF